MFKKKFILSLLVSFAFTCLRAQVNSVDPSSAGGNYLIPNYPGNFTGYYDGFSVIFRSNHTCSASPTLNIAGLGPRPIVNTAGAALTAGDIRLDQVVTLIYDNANSRFQMITASGNVGGGGGVTGGGTASYIPRWATASTLTTSVMFDDGSNIGVGTPSPTGKLSVLTTSGAADAFNVAQQGTGHAGVFSQSNASNDSASLMSYTLGNGTAVLGINQGLGHAGVFSVDNTLSSGYGLIGSTNGKGKAVFGYQTGLGYGGVFWINNASNDSAAVAGMTNGNGPAVWGVSTGNSGAGVFQITNPVSTAPGLKVTIANSAAPAAVFSGGNVGIDAANPLAKLDARGINAKTANSFENIFQVASSDAATPLALRFGIQTNPTATSRFATIEVDDAGVKRRLELQPNCGDVGIGSSSASGGALYVNGPSAMFANPSGPMNVSINGSLLDASTLTVDGPVRANTNVHSTNAMLAVKDGHIQSQQSAAPTFTVGLSAGVGAYGSLTNATDVAGKISLTTGTGSFAAGTQIQIEFNKIYTIPPVVILTPTNANAALAFNSRRVFVNSTGASFTINFGSTETIPSTNYTWNYYVIETQ